MQINFKQKNSLIRIIIWIVLIASFLIVLISLPYYLNFQQDHFSNVASDWGAFGSYLSGISGIINLAVFMMLTIYIARLGHHNSENQIKSEKKILISQFRQHEVKKLSDSLDVIFESHKEKNHRDINLTYSRAGKALLDFIKQNSYLFPIIEKDPFKSNAESLDDKYSDMINLRDEYKNLEVDAFDILEEKMSIKVQEIIFLKNDLIKFLQKFTIEELKL